MKKRWPKRMDKRVVSQMNKLNERINAREAAQKKTIKVVRNGFVFSDMDIAIDNLSHSIDLMIIELLNKNNNESRNNDQL